MSDQQFPIVYVDIGKLPVISLADCTVILKDYAINSYGMDRRAFKHAGLLPTHSRPSRGWRRHMRKLKARNRSSHG